MREKPCEASHGTLRLREALAKANDSKERQEKGSAEVKRLQLELERSQSKLHSYESAPRPEFLADLASVGAGGAGHRPDDPAGKARSSR